jgi:hypothetical protein
MTKPKEVIYGKHHEYKDALSILTNQWTSNVNSHGYCSLSVYEKIVDGGCTDRFWSSSSPTTCRLVSIIVQLYNISNIQNTYRENGMQSKILRWARRRIPSSRLHEPGY